MSCRRCRRAPSGFSHDIFALTLSVTPSVYRLSRVRNGFRPNLLSTTCTWTLSIFYYNIPSPGRRAADGRAGGPSLPSMLPSISTTHTLLDFSTPKTTAGAAPVPSSQVSTSRPLFVHCGSPSCLHRDRSDMMDEIIEETFHATPS